MPDLPIFPAKDFMNKNDPEFIQMFYFYSILSEKLLAECKKLAEALIIEFQSDKVIRDSPTSNQFCYLLEKIISNGFHRNLPFFFLLFLLPLPFFLPFSHFSSLFTGNQPAWIPSYQYSPFSCLLPIPPWFPSFPL